MGDLAEVHIGEIYATGMHHWAVRKLKVNSSYNLLREARNPKDKNAVVIKDGPTVTGYIQKEHAEIIAPMMDSGRLKEIKFVCDGEPVTLHPRRGPQQQGTVVLKVTKKDSVLLCRVISERGLMFSVTDIK